MERYEDNQVEDFIEQEDWQIEEEEEKPKKPLPLIIGGSFLILLILFLGIYSWGKKRQLAKVVKSNLEEQTPIVVDFDPLSSGSPKEEMTQEEFWEKEQPLYTYNERRPIPANPFSSIPRPEPKNNQHEEEEIVPGTGQEQGEGVVGEDPTKGTPPVEYPHYVVKGIAGNQVKRVAILQAGNDSKIICKGDVLDIWRVDNIFNDRIQLTNVMDGLAYELVLGGEG